jgi:hypothetical protein
MLLFFDTRRRARRARSAMRMRWHTAPCRRADMRAPPVRDAAGFSMTFFTIALLMPPFSSPMPRFSLLFFAPRPRVFSPPVADARRRDTLPQISDSASDASPDYTFALHYL